MNQNFEKLDIRAENKVAFLYMTVLRKKSIDDKFSTSRITRIAAKVAKVNPFHFK